jgi:hypothetical protein
MKCYMCDLEGGDSEAVAICIVCGMGLCLEHALREELPVWEGGYEHPSHKMKLTLPRFVCKDCYDALHQSQQPARPGPSP